MNLDQKDDDLKCNLNREEVKNDEFHRCLKVVDGKYIRVTDPNDFDDINHFYITDESLSVPVLKMSDFIRMGVLPYQFIDKQMFTPFNRAKNVMAITHKWMTVEHPDPDNVIIEKLSEDFKQDNDLHVFYDFSCLPQNYEEVERSKNSRIQFETHARQMASVYALSEYHYILPDKELDNSAWCFFEKTIVNLTKNRLIMNDMKSTKEVFKYLRTSFEDLRCSIKSDKALIKSMMKDFLMKMMESGNLKYVKVNFELTQKLKSKAFTEDWNCLHKIMMFFWCCAPFSKRRLVFYETLAVHDAYSLPKVVSEYTLADTTGYLLPNCCNRVVVAQKENKYDIEWEYYSVDGKMSEFVFTFSRKLNGSCHYIYRPSNITDETFSKIFKAYGSYESFLEGTGNGVIEETILNELVRSNAIDFRFQNQQI
jgi:hypothetical protein